MSTVIRLTDLENRCYIVYSAVSFEFWGASSPCFEKLRPMSLVSSYICENLWLCHPSKYMRLDELSLILYMRKPWLRHPSKYMRPDELSLILYMRKLMALPSNE